MQTTVPPVPHRDASCADGAAAPPVAGLGAPLFPPRDADPETYRAWIAASPWPEVVFAAAGHR